MKDLYIIGSGGFSKQVIEIVEEVNKSEKKYNLKGIIDDDKDSEGKKILGYKVVGNTNYLHQLSLKKEINAVIAIGEGKTREKIYNSLPNIKWINLIHPKSIISKYISIGEGNIICGGVVINPECKIGNHVNLNIGSTLGHDVRLSDFTTIMPGANLSGNVNVENNTTIGTGSAIIQEINIGEKSTIGAGAVVVRNTDGNSLYIGIPAKKIKNII